VNLLTELLSSLLDVELLNKTAELTEELRDEATKAGWPTIVVIQLEVVIKDDEFDIDYPAEVSEQIEILEYGTETTPPNPVLRTFMKELKKKVTS
jgi:hypothetical protein